jgi:hypothetical protein
MKERKAPQFAMFMLENIFLDNGTKFQSLPFGDSTQLKVRIQNEAIRLTHQQETGKKSSALKKSAKKQRKELSLNAVPESLANFRKENKSKVSYFLQPSMNKGCSSYFFFE